MNHLFLLDRIKKLDIATIEKMSPEIMARLTDGFNESLVKNVIYVGTTNPEQRRIIHAVKNAYRDWKKDDPYWGNPPLFPETYPQFLEELQMDIECGLVVTKEGIVEDVGNKLLKALTSSQTNAVQRVIDTIHKSGQTVKAEDNDNIEDEEEENYMKLAPWEDVRIAQLEEENTKLRDELHQLKEYVKDYITFDHDNEIAYIKDFGVDNDKNTQKIQSEIKKDVEEKGKEELEAEIKRLKVLLEATDNQLKRYQEEDALTEDIDEAQKLVIDERIIFVSALLGVSLKPDVVNQKQLAKLIEKLTGDTAKSIRPRISSLNSETQKVNDHKIDKFSESTQIAAKNVYELINKAVRGATRENKGYQCKQAMEIINQTYQLGIKM